MRFTIESMRQGRTECIIINFASTFSPSNFSIKSYFSFLAWITTSSPDGYIYQGYQSVWQFNYNTPQYWSQLEWSDRVIARQLESLCTPRFTLTNTEFARLPAFHPPTNPWDAETHRVHPEDCVINSFPNNITILYNTIPYPMCGWGHDDREAT